MTRLTPKFAAALVAAGALAVTGVAGAATTTSGTINIVGAATTVNGNSHDVVYGAINDYGYDTSVNKTYQKVVLQKGTFEVDGTKLNNSFRYKQNSAKCYAYGVGTGKDLPLSHGTGAYKNISGTISVTIRFFALGKIVNGKCKINKEIAGVSQLNGTGHVSY